MTTAEPVLPGTRAGEVIERIRARGAGARDDRRLALVVEGGGMRGALSGGGLVALDLLGYRGVFDLVVATSAGAVNAAYFLSNQGQLGITVYFDSINNRKFYNPLRLGKIVDVDFVYDQVVPIEKPLDEAAIRGGSSEFYIVGTDVETGDAELFDARTSPHPIPQLLKASSALPVLYDRAVPLAPGRFVDGGIADAIPLLPALALGATDVLVLLTRPPSYRSRPPKRWQKLFFDAMIGRRHPALRDAYRTSYLRSNRARRVAAGEEEVAATVNIATLFPPAAAGIVERTTIDRGKLVEGAYRMALQMAALLSGETAEIEKAFDAFRRRTGPLYDDSQ